MYSPRITCWRYEPRTTIKARDVHTKIKFPKFYFWNKADVARYICRIGKVAIHVRIAQRKLVCTVNAYEDGESRVQVYILW